LEVFESIVPRRILGPSKRKEGREGERKLHIEEFRQLGVTKARRMIRAWHEARETKKCIQNFNSKT
jgi:hypothetical protein